MNPERERYLKHTKEYDETVTQAIAAQEFQLHLRRKELDWALVQAWATQFACIYYAEPEYPELIYPHAYAMGLHHLFN